MKNFTYHHLNEYTIGMCDTKVNEINEALEIAAEAITNLFEDFGSQMDQELKDEYNRTYQKLFDDVKIQIDQISEKAVEIRGSISTKQASLCKTTLDDGDDSSFQAERLKLLERQVAALELANQNSVQERCNKDSEAARLSISRRNAAIKKGVAKYHCIMDKVTELEEKIRKVDDWTEVSDLEIGRYMNEIKDWNTDMDKLIKLSSELEELRADHALTAGEVPSDNGTVVDGLNDELRLVIDTVKEQDDLRALFTLDKAKSDPVKLPIFEGKDLED